MYTLLYTVLFKSVKRIKEKKDPAMLHGFILCRIEDRMRALTGKSKRAATQA